MEDAIRTCMCGEHKHLLREKEHCEKCHAIEEELQRVLFIEAIHFQFFLSFKTNDVFDIS